MRFYEGKQSYRLRNYYDSNGNVTTRYGSLTMEDFCKYFVKIHCIVGEGKMMNEQDLRIKLRGYDMRLYKDFGYLIDSDEMFKCIGEMFEYDEEEELIYGVETRDVWLSEYHALIGMKWSDRMLELLSVTEAQKESMNDYFLKYCDFHKSHFEDFVEISLLYQHYKKNCCGPICDPYVFRYWYAHTDVIPGRRNEDDIYAEYCPEIGG
jgi:hypothetical protein